MAASAVDIPAGNINGNKTLLARGVSKLFINGKLAFINGLGNVKNSLSWQVIFLVVPFNKIPLFSKDLITFAMSFISLFVRVIPKPVIREIAF